MPARSKKERKVERKRNKQKRARAAKEKRRRLRTAESGDQEANLFADPAESELVSRSSTNDQQASDQNTSKKNPQIVQWWERYMDADGVGRIGLVREKLRGELDEEWREAVFPESVFEAERTSKPEDYVALLESLAENHRDIYQDGLLWFLRSRVTHYLASGQRERIEQAVTQDAADMTETGEALYGTLSMLRLASMESSADDLALAGHRCMDATELMPWAIEEIESLVMHIHIRNCVRLGGTSDAIEAMESEFEQLNAVMDEDVVQVRREMIQRFVSPEPTVWQRNQLLGTSRSSIRNRYLLSIEFAAWLIQEHSIAMIAADEMRGLWSESLSESLDMRSYLDGIPQPALDRHLASLLGFMQLDRFKAPATLIAVDYFVDFLALRGLANPKSVAKTKASVNGLEAQLRRLLNDEWESYKFLDPLRREDKKR